MEQITTILGALFIIARVLRKAIPDAAQTGSLGTFLKHIALEINPQLTPTPPTVPNPPTVLTDVKTGATVQPETIKPKTP